MTRDTDEQPSPRPWGDLGLGAAGAAVGVSYAVTRSSALHRRDGAVARLLSRPLGTAADTAFGAATDLGSVYAIVGISGVLAATGRRRLALDVAGAGLVAWTVAQGMKPLANRPRPYQADGTDRLVAEPAGSSWPSGHAAVGTALAATVSPRLPKALRPLAVAYGAFVACSRVYVGVHYPSDAIGGVGAGYASARLWSRLRAILGRVVRAVRR